MSKELVIGSNRHETKVAVLEDDQLVEVYFQRANEYSLAGSIHKGRVTRVLPGMQSAFVDLGLERDTFLYVSDFFEEHDDIDTVSDEKPAAAPRGPERGDRGERNDRARGDRGRERYTQQESVPAEKPVEPFAPVSTAFEAEDAADIEDAPVDAAPPVEVRPERVELRAPQQQGVPSLQARTPDRGDDRNRGDRRGRRSRRRRRGGRDFPENKYAQPDPASTSPAPPNAVSSAAQPVRQHVTEDIFGSEAEPADVIILPGESLAKYRQKPPDQGLRMQQPAAPEEPTDEAATEEELTAEAEELELADRIFAHREDESVEAEDEKIAEVSHDQAAPHAELAHELAPELAEDEHVESVVEIYSEVSEATLIEPDEAESFRYSLGVVETEEEVEHIEPLTAESRFEALEADEFEFNDSDETLPELEEIAPEVEDALGQVAGEPGIVGEPVSSEHESSQPIGPQSATLRDQGGRSMHRVSRRMRRRRGGNRFSQGEPGSGSSSAGVVSSGTAAAMEPEARAEVKREPLEERSYERPERIMPSITELLKPGQEIIVQIAKEPLGQKGARITSHIALPGRYVVFMPSVMHLGVSRKVASEEERQRLKRILQTHREGTTGGFIVRTAGEGIPEEEIAADMSFLYSLWLDIRQKAEKKPAPLLLHYDLDVVQRILRDQVTDEFKAIWVDNEDLYESVLTFMQRFQPALVNRVKMYTRQAPIFDAFNITQELEKALRPKVWLKSGGYIVINQTEALVAIDINTGKYVGKSNRLEDTIVKTNIEAVKEIVRQIRLRDLGGIIVVDFIDMDERKNRQKVMQALEEAMRSDKAPYKILQFNDFGLVAITRKRVKQSLERTLCAPCPYCEGAGYVKSVQTIVSEILVEAQKIARAIEGKDVVLRVHPEVAKTLKASDNKYLEELEEILRRPVLVKGDATLHHEKFDLG